MRRTGSCARSAHGRSGTGRRRTPHRGGADRGGGQDGSEGGRRQAHGRVECRTGRASRVGCCHEVPVESYCHLKASAPSSRCEPGGFHLGCHHAFLLDAYSDTVSGVVERAGPSVAAVQVQRPAEQSATRSSAAARAFCSRPTVSAEQLARGARRRQRAADRQASSGVAQRRPRVRGALGRRRPRHRSRGAAHRRHVRAARSRRFRSGGLPRSKRGEIAIAIGKPARLRAHGHRRESSAHSGAACARAAAG